VADQPSLTKQLGVTPAKLAIIAVLAVVLVGSLYRQFGGTAEEAVPVAQKKREPAQSKSGKEATQAAEQDASDTELQDDITEEIDGAVWKAPELASVIQYDPFAIPATFPQPKQDIVGVELAEGAVADVAASEVSEEERLAALQELQAALEQLRQQGVQVIFKHRDQYVAMIGDKTVHVGDEIGGFKVIAIDRGGVQVERTTQQ